MAVLEALSRQADATLKLRHHLKALRGGPPTEETAKLLRTYHHANLLAESSVNMWKVGLVRSATSGAQHGE